MRFGLLKEAGHTHKKLSWDAWEELFLETRTKNSQGTDMCLWCGVHLACSPHLACPPWQGAEERERGRAWPSSIQWLVSTRIAAPRREVRRLDKTTCPLLLPWCSADEEGKGRFNKRERQTRAGLEWGHVWRMMGVWWGWWGLTDRNQDRELVQFTSVAQSCPTLCNPMHCSTPGLPVHHQLPEFT